MPCRDRSRRGLGGAVDAPDGAVGEPDEDLVPPADAVHGGLHDGDGEGRGNGGVGGVAAHLQHADTGLGGQGLGRRDRAILGAGGLEYALGARW